MAPMENGKVAIKYRRVQCTPPSGLNIVVDQNAGAGGTLRLTVQVPVGCFMTHNLKDRCRFQSEAESKPSLQ